MTEKKRIFGYIQTKKARYNMKIDMQPSERVIWMDLLRIVSVFSVIVIHAASVGNIGFNTFSDVWLWCNLYLSFSRFAVPVLVMISGVMLLDPKKDYSMKKIFLQKIFRLATAFVLWVIFYSTVSQLRQIFCMILFLSTCSLS